MPALDTAHEHGDGIREVILDVDPEAVRRGVKSLMQQVAQIERERVSFKKTVHLYELILISFFNASGGLEIGAEHHEETARRGSG